VSGRGNWELPGAAGRTFLFCGERAACGEMSLDEDKFNSAVSFVEGVLSSRPNPDGDGATEIWLPSEIDYIHFRKAVKSVAGVHLDFKNSLNSPQEQDKDALRNPWAWFSYLFTVRHDQTRLNRFKQQLATQYDNDIRSLRSIISGLMVNTEQDPVPPEERTSVSVDDFRENLWKETMITPPEMSFPKSLFLSRNFFVKPLRLDDASSPSPDERAGTARPETGTRTTSPETGTRTVSPETGTRTAEMAFIQQPNGELFLGVPVADGQPNTAAAAARWQRASGRNTARRPDSNRTHEDGIANIAAAGQAVRRNSNISRSSISYLPVRQFSNSTVQNDSDSDEGSDEEGSDSDSDDAPPPAVPPPENDEGDEGEAEELSEDNDAEDYNAVNNTIEEMIEEIDQENREGLRQLFHSVNADAKDDVAEVVKKMMTKMIDNVKKAKLKEEAADAQRKWDEFQKKQVKPEPEKVLEAIVELKRKTEKKREELRSHNPFPTRATSSINQVVKKPPPLRSSASAQLLHSGGNPPPPEDWKDYLPVFPVDSVDGVKEFLQSLSNLFESLSLLRVTDWKEDAKRLAGVAKATVNQKFLTGGLDLWRREVYQAVLASNVKFDKEVDVSLRDHLLKFINVKAEKETKAKKPPSFDVSEFWGWAKEEDKRLKAFNDDNDDTVTDLKAVADKYSEALRMIQPVDQTRMQRFAGLLKNGGESNIAVQLAGENTEKAREIVKGLRGLFHGKVPVRILLDMFKEWSESENKKEFEAAATVAITTSNRDFSYVYSSLKDQKQKDFRILPGAALRFARATLKRHEKMYRHRGGFQVKDLKTAFRELTALQLSLAKAKAVDESKTMKEAEKAKVKNGKVWAEALVAGMKTGGTEEKVKDAILSKLKGLDPENEELKKADNPVAALKVIANSSDLLRRDRRAGTRVLDAGEMLFRRISGRGQGEMMGGAPNEGSSRRTTEAVAAYSAIAAALFQAVAPALRARVPPRHAGWLQLSVALAWTLVSIPFLWTRGGGWNQFQISLFAIGTAAAWAAFYASYEVQKGLELTKLDLPDMETVRAASRTYEAISLLCLAGLVTGSFAGSASPSTTVVGLSLLAVVGMIVLLVAYALGMLGTGRAGIRSEWARSA